MAIVYGVKRVIVMATALALIVISCIGLADGGGTGVR